MLYLCATPIGNLGDITLRVIDVLKNADLILAEDTRHSLLLLNHLEIKKPMLSFHKFSDNARLNQIIDKLKNGENIALISDAGTPCISDPGYKLVEACINENIEFTALPGATAFTTALVMSGLSTESFLFYGFLPQKKFLLESELNNLKTVSSTLIFYEAPHRISKTLTALKQHLGNRKIAVCRELTKKFEEIKRCTIEEVQLFYENNEPKGEFVLVVEGYVKTSEDDIDYYKEYKKYLDLGTDKKEAIKLISERAGVPKREVYNYIAKLTEEK